MSNFTTLIGNFLILFPFYFNVRVSLMIQCIAFCKKRDGFLTKTLR